MADRRFRWGALAGGAAALVVAATAYTIRAQSPAEHALLRQSDAEAAEKSRGCLSCHEGIEPMHASPAVKLGCIDCHGGDASAVASSVDDQEAKKRAHVQPRHPEIWSRDGKYSSANPQQSYTASLRESAAFIRFVNPGDL
ncbi:MAG TPA: hypothetical protein VFL80_09035, partial [Thermoanaerobaculia bacterium]|nr:hypothetical protein [Thermoanaerobaculia bacterium]